MGRSRASKEQMGMNGVKCKASGGDVGAGMASAKRPFNNQHQGTAQDKNALQKKRPLSLRYRGE